MALTFQIVKVCVVAETYSIAKEFAEVPAIQIARVSTEEHPPTIALEIAWDPESLTVPEPATIPARVDQPTFAIAMERVAQLEKFRPTSRIALVLVSNRLAFPWHLVFSDPSFKLMLLTRSNTRLSLPRRLPSRRRTLKRLSLVLLD